MPDIYIDKDTFVINGEEKTITWYINWEEDICSPDNFADYNSTFALGIEDIRCRDILKRTREAYVEGYKKGFIEGRS